MDKDEQEFAEMSHRIVYTKFDRELIKKIEQNIKKEHVKAKVWFEAEMRGRVKNGDWDKLHQGALCYVKHNRLHEYYLYLLKPYTNASETKVCVKINAEDNALLNEKFVCIYDALGNQKVHAIFCSVESAKKWFDIFQRKQNKRHAGVPLTNKVTSMLFSSHGKQTKEKEIEKVESNDKFNRTEPTATAPKTNNAVKKVKNKTDYADSEDNPDNVDNVKPLEDTVFNSWSEEPRKSYTVEPKRSTTFEAHQNMTFDSSINNSWSQPLSASYSPQYPDTNSFYMPNLQSTQMLFQPQAYVEEIPPAVPRRGESIPQPPQRKPPPTMAPPPRPPIQGHYRQNVPAEPLTPTKSMVSSVQSTHFSSNAPPPPLPRHNRNERVPKFKEAAPEPLIRAVDNVIVPPKRNSSIVQSPVTPTLNVVSPPVSPNVVVNKHNTKNTSAKNTSHLLPSNPEKSDITANNIAAIKVQLKPLSETTAKKDLKLQQRSTAPHSNNNESVAKLSIVVKTNKTSSQNLKLSKVSPPSRPKLPSDLSCEADKTDEKPLTSSSEEELEEVKPATLPLVSEIIPPPPPPPPPATALTKTRSATLPAVTDSRANLMDSIRSFGGIQGMQKVNLTKPKSPLQKLPPSDDLNSALKLRMASMRKYIESDNEQDDETWED